MRIRKVVIKIALILILSFPLIFIFAAHQFIKHPEYWKNSLAFLKGAKYLGEDGVIIQREANDCGPASLKMIFDYFKVPVDLEEISKKVVGERGSNMLSLKEMAELEGLKTEGWRFSFEDLKNIKLPAIAFINGNHYVVISEIAEDIITILDPSIGKLRYSSQRFRSKWKGETLIFRKKQ